MQRLLSVIIFSILLTWQATAYACEVALALAVDVSGSVNKEEYNLQMKGLADALRDSTVAEALVQKQAAIMLVQWSGTSRQSMVLPWQRIENFDQLDQIANEIERTPRKWRNFSTAIGEALTFTVSKFSQVTDCKRKVIDVSGDGYSNEGGDPVLFREELRRRGFTVNALAIEGSAENLTGYYRDNVITGAGAFVMTANDFEEYPKRIRQKLLREVTKKLASLQ